MWLLQLYCHVQLRAALELVGTRSHSRLPALSRTRKNSLKLSHSLALARTRSLVCPPVGSHSRELAHFLELARLVLQNHSNFTRFLTSCYSSNESICYVATKFCENILMGVGDDSKTQFKRMPPSG